MNRSPALARTITVIIAVVLAPLGVGLLIAGGRVWMLTVFQYGRGGYDIGDIAGPTALQGLGILLLIGVVATGLWSSAGLIAAGVVGLLPVVLALFPAALMGIQRVVRVPLEMLDGIIYGAPLALLPALGAMGLALAMARRRPEPTGAGPAIAGGILSPVLLATGAALLVWGVGTGMLRAYQRFEMDVQPVAAAAVLGGVLLVVAGIGATRWSPLALLVPAVALLVLNGLVLLPDVLFPALAALPREVSYATPALLLFGTGTAAAFLYLSYTFVLMRVRARAALPPAPPVAQPAYAPAPPTYPTYPPSPAQYFPGSGVGPAPHAPAVPPYPPAPGPGPSGS